MAVFDAEVLTTQFEQLLDLLIGGPIRGRRDLVDFAAKALTLFEDLLEFLAVSHVLLKADEEQLKQLIKNLIRNAIEHGGEDVTVRVGEPDDGFYIADDGPGIAPADREQAFNVGYTRSDTGTGYGLSIVKQVVEAHDWDVAITDSSDGGAQFKITSVDIQH